VNYYVLDDDRNDVLYLASHIKHPSAIWCRESNNNYNWLYCHLVELIEEYKYRYGNKKHKTEKQEPSRMDTMLWL
jgi:hypothetical protein